MDYEGERVKGVWADENLARQQVEELKKKNVYCDRIEIVFWEGETRKEVAHWVSDFTKENPWQ